MSLPRTFLLAVGLAASLWSASSHAQATAANADYRVLLVGNSLTYINNLPALLRAVGASQGKTIVTETYAAPSGALAERLRDGHVASALAGGRFNVLVLQEQGGQVACLASAAQQRKAPCAASVRAHQELARLGAVAGARTFLFTTWARDERGQARIDSGMRQLAKQTGATVFDAAGAVASLHKARPAMRPYPDGIHPSTQASLMLAFALYRDITGTAPVAKDLRVTAPLLPVNAALSPASALESQAALAGTGQVTVVPANLLEPLVNALADPKASAEVNPTGRRR